jgi:hypothetical protein
LDRIPRASELTADELSTLRRLATASFTPATQVNALQRDRLLELGLIQRAMGGLMATPAGRILTRLR